MKYIGIDLGTTNSAIASYDGAEVTLYKSPEQQDVTPSALFYDRRGNRYVGLRAYNNSIINPDQSATLFKRMMGTSTKFRIQAANIELLPEECSAEVLRTLFGYLPEEMRNSTELATVITVPAAFNQMQKDATLSAAEMAGIGQVALMQEPVAAVMSVMKRRRSDGIFIIYDLGGGTLDIAVAQSAAGGVSLLAHGGIAMCGGRDFDRSIVDSVVQPWLSSSFNLPADPAAPERKRLARLASWASEKAKIELSQRPEAEIVLGENELNLRDLDGRDVFIDAPLTRETLNGLMEERIEDSIRATRETLERSGLAAEDVERIVFVGGPTFYAPLREKVSFELGIASSTEVNPMTAVAEGAAIFAESIDWGTRSLSKKSSRGTIASAQLSLAFAYAARTPAISTRLSAQLAGAALPGAEFDVESLETGWSSGRIALIDGASAELPLSRDGDNNFRISLFDPVGGSLPLANNQFVITRTAVSVDGIPASQSIGVEVRERVGGRSNLDYLIREGEPLPKKGTRRYKTEHSLRAGDTKSINFKLWEGDIADPISDNTFIGVFSIKGTDIGDQMIPSGADLICEFEIRDSGNINLEIIVPSAQGSFNSNRNFYSRQEGQLDFEHVAALLDEQREQIASRIESLSPTIPDQELAPVRKRLEAAERIRGKSSDAEETKQAAEYLQEAKRLLGQTRLRNLSNIREIELGTLSNLFNENARKFATPNEQAAFDNLARSADRAIAKSDSEFEILADDMRSRVFAVLWRQDDFVRDRFRWFDSSPFLFVDPAQYDLLRGRGENALTCGDMGELRRVVQELDEIRFGSSSDSDVSFAANIIRG